jgi:hypothetical protein
MVSFLSMYRKLVLPSALAGLMPLLLLLGGIAAS